MTRATILRVVGGLGLATVLISGCSSDGQTKPEAIVGTATSPTSTAGTSGKTTASTGQPSVTAVRSTSATTASKTSPTVPTSLTVASTSQAGPVSLSVSSPVSAGGTATAIAQAAPNVTCILSYTTPAGSPSAAAGLGSRTTGSDGSASWSWTIGGSTGKGTGSVKVTCNGQVATAAIVIQ